MVKTISKKFLSILLALCVCFSTISVSSISASAGAGAFFAELAAEKLIELTMRGLAEGCEALGEATGNEDAEKAFSIISTWVLSDGAEAAVAEVQELCEEILERLDEIEENMNDCFSEVERMLGKDAANTAKTNLDNQWEKDVDDVIGDYEATASLEKYMTYMQNAVDYKNSGLSGKELEEALQPDVDNLIRSFANMYDNNIPVEDNNPEGIKKHIFANTAINTKFENMITALANNLVKDNSTSIAEYAAQFAYETYPFSHQQYTYVYTVMEKQLTELQTVEMLYNEYLYQQGKYIEETYGKDSEQYKGYLNEQTYFRNLMYDEKTGAGVNSKIEEMLEYKMTVDSSAGVKMSLNDYMKPEDAQESVTLKINNYKSSYSLTMLNGGTNSYIITTKPVYIKETVKFNRVMTHSGSNSGVYYIIDPSQFSSSDALQCLSLDYKHEVPRAPDDHIASCDFHNLINTMSDGKNTFAVPKDGEKLSGLFGTNAFSLKSRYPDSYLDKYLPNKGDNTVFYFLTSEYEDIKHGSSVSTSYSDLYLLSGSDQAPGTKLNSEKVSLEKFQSDKGGDIYKYSVILANNNDTYKQNAQLQVKGENGISSAKIVNENSSTTVNNGESKEFTSGEMLSVKFKLNDGAEFKSLKCIRNSDAVNGSGTKTETVLLEKDDISMLAVDDDGYYSFEYAMPYSDTTFVVEANNHDFNDNGFCKNCGAYQPAVLNHGVYEISNAGMMYWFAALVNGDETHADFNAQNASAKGVLVKNIDLENREWNPIMKFSGSFDGQGNSISSFKINSTSSNSGLFGTAYGTITDFTLNGEIKLSADGDKVGGVVGYADGATVTNVTSNVNISNTSGVLRHTGGVIGYVENKETVVEKCINYGNVNIINSTDCFGGVVGYSNAGARIKDCANHGSISATEDGAYVGGILGYVNNTNPTLKDCYNYGNVSNGGNTTHCGAIIGWARNFTVANIDNNYYLDSSAVLAFGSGGKSGLKATAKTSSEFKSGEVAYLLNNSITDGSQAWYQNIDNGEKPDDYPKFTGGTVYYGYACNDTEKTYSNYPLSDSIATGHIFDDNGFCTICGDYQPAVLNSDVYEISNAGMLYWFASLVNGDKTHADFDSQNGGANAVLVKDITVNSYDVNNLDDTQLKSTRKWAPIGSHDCSYTGQFDGQRHTISGLYFKDTNADYVGLFGYTRGGADIYNVGVINSYFEGKNNVGAILGLNNNTGVTVQRCFSEATVIGNECVSGIAGSTYSGKIIDCYNAGTIKGSKYVASIRGRNTHSSSGEINNCFNVGSVTGTGTEHVGGIRGDGVGSISNCYCISNQLTDTAATTKTPEQFASGEVAYLLNNSVTDGKQVWYQNIDNGKTPDNYPKFTGGTVYKVDLEDKTYSNYPAKAPSKLEQIDLRTYQRIYENGSLSPKSKIAYGYGKVDEESKTITLYMADTAERIGILMHQGENGSKGIMTLEGDYPKFSETSDVLIREGREVPVYTDGNGCIFIANPETNEGVPTEFTLKYTEKPVDDHTPTYYTLKIEVIEAERFEAFGASIGGYMVSSLNKNDPDYKVLHSDDGDADTDDETDVTQPTDEDVNNNKNTNKSKTSPQTGNDFAYAVPFGIALITAFALVLVCKRKRRNNI